MKFLDALKLFGPAILAVVPGAQPFVPLIVAGMAVAEESTKKGKDKKAIALASVKAGAVAANIIAAKKGMQPILDEDKAVALADSVIDEVVAGIKEITTLEAVKDFPTIQP